jgi:hypothetical protein
MKEWTKINESAKGTQLKPMEINPTFIPIKQYDRLKFTRTKYNLDIHYEKIIYYKVESILLQPGKIALGSSSCSIRSIRSVVRVASLLQ